MLDGFAMDGTKMVCSVTQMYDYVHLEFSIGMPYDTCFMVNLTDKDIDRLIALLQKAKGERPKKRRK